MRHKQKEGRGGGGGGEKEVREEEEEEEEKGVSGNLSECVVNEEGHGFVCFSFPDSCFSFCFPVFSFSPWNITVGLHSE